MGIHGINPFLKALGIDCFFLLPLTVIAQQRVCLDALNMLFKYLPQAQRRALEQNEDILDPICQKKLLTEMKLELTRLNNKLMNHQVTPIWIWDGVSKDNKTATKKERRKNRQTLIDEREQLRKEILGLPILERSVELLEKYKNMSLKTAYFSNANIEALKIFTKEIGLPTIYADDEAENLASSLAIQRKISCVFSTDTDTYPLGAPVIINKFEHINGEVYIKGVFTLKILKHLDMTHEEFRDFCILLGTDFNVRIGGIGPKKSQLLIDKYSSLEEVEKNTSHNLSFMNYKEVREQLTPYLTNHTCDDFQVNKDVCPIKLKEHLDSDEMDTFYNNIRDLPRSKPVPKI